MGTFKKLYSLSLSSAKNNQSLHFAAHSHHLWPDCTFDAHKAYWLDSNQMLDQKWNKIFGEVVPSLQKNIAQTLNLSRPEQIVFAPNTHEFVVRILSCFAPTKKIKVLTTDSEFHSFRRQIVRLQQAGLADVDFIEVEPYETFERRWSEKIVQNKYDLIFTSQVYFNSGFQCPELSGWIPKVDVSTLIAIDGYHSYFAIPLDLKPFEERIFFLAGGYKYAQSGEGVCFMHTPLNTLEPLNTGWFASFETLEKPQSSKIEYSKDAMRFAGSTFDPSGCYRMNAIFEMYEENSLSVESVHNRIENLKNYFLKKIKALNHEVLDVSKFVQSPHGFPKSHFLTLRTNEAQSLQKLFEENHIQLDSRGDRLRFGFGLYHDLEDIDLLVERLETILQYRDEKSFRHHDAKSGGA